MTTRRVFITLCFMIILAIAAGSGAAETGQDQKNLQLEVIINGVPANMIGSFVLFAGKRIGATRNELEDVGLDIGRRRFPEDIVMLDDIPGLQYLYDEPTQTIRITVDNSKRRGQTFDLSGGKAKASGENRLGRIGELRPTGHDRRRFVHPQSTEARRLAERRRARIFALRNIRAVGHRQLGSRSSK